MPAEITVFRTIAEMRSELEPLRRQGAAIGLVPTMGALHAGHLSLARESIKQCDYSIASIFVNPTQFAPDEDLAQYPRTFEQDSQLLKEVGVDAIFFPQVEEMYPDGYSTAVSPPKVAEVLEGEFRATHFGGVCSIVLKLFNAVMPTKAFFGQKDYQQAAVIRQMVADLNVAVEIVVCPVVRDKDGLALSSRNRYLSEQEKQIALSLSRTLQFVADEIHGGEADGHALMAEMRQMLIDGGVTSVDYAAICEPRTLAIVDEIEKPVVALIAAHVGETRLIDNRFME